MVISQPPGNNPSYYYRASPTLPQLLWMLPETPYVLYMQLQHQAPIEMVLLSIFLHESDPRRDHQQIVLLFILSLHAFALHLVVVNITSNLSVWRFEHVGLTYICRLYFPRMPARPHFVTQPILLSENIPNIWHKSSTKHKEVRPDWNDKTIMQTTRPRIMKVLPMAQVTF